MFREFADPGRQSSWQTPVAGYQDGSKMILNGGRDVGMVSP
jgi:hypothetical protein